LMIVWLTRPVLLGHSLLPRVVLLIASQVAFFPPGKSRVVLQVR